MPKSSRFAGASRSPSRPQTERVGPGSYDVVTASVDGISIKFKGGRKDSAIQDTPGPGHYDAIDLETIKAKAPTSRLV